MMATATTETAVPRMKQAYNEELRARLKDELEPEHGHAGAAHLRRSR